jgi:CDP-diglyceride synthetase
MVKLDSKDVLLWIAELWQFCVAILVLIVLLFWAVACPVTEKGIRKCGFLIQVLGMVIAWVQIYQLKKMYKVQQVWSMFNSWWERRPWIRVVANNGVSEFPSMKGESIATQQYFPLYGLDLKEQILSLKKDVDNIKALISDNNEIVMNRFLKIESCILSNFKETSLKLNTVEEKIKDTAVGGVLYVELSMLYIFFGSLLTTFSDVVESWFK